MKKQNNKNKHNYYYIILIIIIIIILYLLVCGRKRLYDLYDNDKAISVFIPKEKKITPPKIVSKIERELVSSSFPEAPEWLDAEGKYTLKVIAFVQKSGVIKSIKLKSSTGNISVDNLLISYIKKWRFNKSNLKLEKINLNINYEVE